MFVVVEGGEAVLVTDSEEGTKAECGGGEGGEELDGGEGESSRISKIEESR